MTEKKNQMKATKTLHHCIFEKNTMPQPTTDQIHVLVVIPKQGTSFPPVSKSGVFGIFTNPFFTRLLTVVKNGDWLNFSLLLPLTRLETLYIRHAYK
ncbi:hypothetical protein PsorP6_015090 [Peronosclerospora sorghi]|uniref:Uncharacterized protein n=1 Tax=Peronosclerospora sorghi TaxID=230839 RepID=A0ACC0VRC5_9STRA|nr:hypothetical protein PsorP6_015090 [Peronosclerospora sorghi]